MSFLKYDGSVAAETPAPSVWVSGVSSIAETLVGTAAANALDGYDGDVLRGGAGDDTYYVKGQGISVVETAGAGVDKIVAWQNVDLSRSANVENLEIGGDRTYGAGNALDNVIVGNGSSGYQLYGGFGQDVLVGSAGRDTFIIVKGTGSDALYNFDVSSDVVRLSAGYKSFAEIQSHMTQVGADVKIDLGGGEGLIIRNVATSQLGAHHFQLGLDASKLGALTFNDDFNSLNLWNGSTGTWATTFWYDSATGNGGTLHSNNEQQWYINANYGPTASVKPWTVDGGQLTLTVAPATADVSAQIGGYKYTSGEINTFQSFAQTYGYFEMRADVPDAEGAWPAFWLMPTDGSWPPELDVMEVLSRDPNAVWTTAHSGATGDHTMSQGMSFIPETTDGFHTYGVLWTKTDLTWFVDGVEVFKTATPADMNKPMYMMANLALGGWGGAVDNADLPAQFKIDYIRSYALADGSSTVTRDTAHTGGSTAPSTPTSTPSSGGATSTPSTPSTPSQPASGDLVLTATGAGAVLTGGAGADTLNASQGLDTLTGGAGADHFVFANEPWAPVHVMDFQLGVDKLDLSALFQKAGYAGADPVAAKYVYFESDGAGGTLVRFDRDAAGADQEWPNTIIDLHGVSPAGLTWAQLQGGSTTSTGSAGGATGGSTGGAIGGGGGGGSAGGGSSVGQQLAAPAHGGALQGGAGADTLTGLDGRNTLFGGDGSDQIIGGASFNQVNGNKGEDTITGKSLVGDWLLGGQGSDVINASLSSGANIINGNIGADTLTGGTGADILRGGQGDDLIFGGGGDDWISGDRGYDTVTGGAGADTIHLFAGSGVVTITDFDAGQGDRVLVSGGAQFSLSEQGGAVVVSVAGGGEAHLLNTSLATFNPGWVLSA